MGRLPLIAAAGIAAIFAAASITPARSQNKSAFKGYTAMPAGAQTAEAPPPPTSQAPNPAAVAPAPSQAQK